MFKAQALRRSFSLFRGSRGSTHNGSRGVPTSQLIRAATRNGHDTIHIQRFRTRQPIFSRSRIFNVCMGTFLVTFSGYVFVKWLDAMDEEDDTNDGWQVATGEGEDEEDDDDTLLFLPTGFSRQKKRTAYKPSDPEMGEYRAFNAVRAKEEVAKKKLIALTRENFASERTKNHPVVRQIRSRIGNIDVRAGQSFLTLVYPVGPRVEYERPGVELTENMTVRRAIRPVEEAEHLFLESILFPTPVANAFYIDSKQRATALWDSFRTSIGLEDETKRKKKALASALTPVTSAAPSLPGSVPAQVETDPSQQQAEPQTRQATSSIPSNRQKSSSPTQDSIAARWMSFIPPVESLTSFLPPAKSVVIDSAVFRDALKRERVKSLTNRPNREARLDRGQVLVGGSVEIVGERGLAILDVNGVYNIKTETFIHAEIVFKAWYPHRRAYRGR